MKLKKLDLPTFEFNRTLPKFLNGLGPDGCDSVFVKVQGIVGGSMNAKLSADLEALGVSAAIMDQERDTLDGAAKIKTAWSQNQKINEGQFGIIFDNCVAEWSTNICGEDGEILEPTRENFVGLAGVRVAEITDVFEAFIAEIKKTTDLIVAGDGEEIKK